MSERVVNVSGLVASPLSPARSMPIVAGNCPACGLASLFLACGGYVTCGSLACSDPGAASALLDGVDAKDAEIDRLVGADRENYSLTAEVQVLREENERLRTALEEIKPYTSASSPVGMIVRDVLASLDGEKEGSAERVVTRVRSRHRLPPLPADFDGDGAESTEGER